MPSKDRVRKNKKREKSKSYYDANKEDILLDRKEKYNSEKRAERHAMDYYKNLAASQVKSAESSEVGYYISSCIMCMFSK